MAILQTGIDSAGGPNTEHINSIMLASQQDAAATPDSNRLELDELGNEIKVKYGTLHYRCRRSGSKIPAGKIRE